jgi:V8-like Glu-specific endopeptidase
MPSVDMAESTACIWRLNLNGTYSPAGCGFMVRDAQVLTCAHVINAALGRPEQSKECPREQDVVELSFDSHGNGQRITATVVGWYAPTGEPSNEPADIALLKLQGKPSGVPELLLRSERELYDHNVRMKGFPLRNVAGEGADGVLKSPVKGWIQMEQRDKSTFVCPGYSGSPVWDLRVEGVVGMVVAQKQTTDANLAYIIPTEPLMFCLRNRLSDPMPNPAIAPTSSVEDECLYVLVELIPTKIHTEAEKDSYTVQAWHYRSEGPKQFYTNDKPTALAAMPAQIFNILDKIRPALRAAKGILTLEFILPTSLLHYPVETWQSEEDFTIGDRYRVVVRSRDRVRAKVDNELILARWNEKRLEVELKEGWFQQFDQLTPGLRELAPLLAKTDVFCLILGCGPPDNAQERGAFLRQIVSMGMPIVLWPRVTAETADTHREKLADLLKTSPLRLLPQKVQLRRTEGFSFTLLWDDPKHSPVRKKRLAAP